MSENISENGGNTAPNPNISEAQQRASRENGQKSHGAVTPEGKAKSRLNAVKCGLTGNFVFFATQDADRYRSHIQSFETQFQPVGPQESALAQSISDVWWRLSRVPGLEQAILSLESIQILEKNPHLGSPEAQAALELEARRRHEKELYNLALQENRLTRRRDREIAQLMRLQSERKENEEAALAEAAKASLLAQHNKQQLVQVPGLGFVFSKHRYAAFMSRLTPAQKAKLLEQAIAESAELPQTMEAAA
jgi:hypothetical protein